MKELINEANTVKTGIQKALQKADQLLGLIETDRAYDDLMNPQNCEKLKAMTTRHKEGMTAWQQKYMNEDIKQVRAANTHNQLEHELKLSNKIEYNEIKVFVELMLRRHSA